MLNEKQLRKDKIGVWILLNFFLCSIPLWVPLFFPNKNTTHLFSSFLAYSYTLLFLNAYLYDNFINITKTSLPQTPKWYAISIGILLLIILILYNLSEKKYNISNILLIILIVIIFGLCFFLSFLLNKPIINKYVEDELERLEQIEKNKFDKASGFDNKTLSMLAKLLKEKTQ